jgi:hypothetical protein
VSTGVLSEWDDDRLPKFRDRLSAPSSTDKHPSTLEDGAERIYRNVGNQPQHTSCKIPEEQRPQEKFNLLEIDSVPYLLISTDGTTISGEHKGNYFNPLK